MSSEQLTTSLEPHAGQTCDNVFKTPDFYLACFLRCSGYELIDLLATDPRKVFVFRDRLSRRADVLAFYGGRATVSPRAFSTTIKDMKALLHNA